LIVWIEHVRVTGRRFALTARASGTYGFSYELEPIGGPLGGAKPEPRTSG
jgi:hypothetical protein